MPLFNLKNINIKIKIKYFNLNKKNLIRFHTIQYSILSKKIKNSYLVFSICMILRMINLIFLLLNFFINTKIYYLFVNQSIQVNIGFTLRF